MQEINRAMGDHLDASEMVKKLKEQMMEHIPVAPRPNVIKSRRYLPELDRFETRAERRARVRDEAKAAERAAKERA